MSTPPPTKPPRAPPHPPDDVAPVPAMVPRSETFLAKSATHWVFLLLSVFVMVAAVSMDVRNETEVIIPIIDKPLPGTCTFLRITGIPCPGCGMTRSFICFAHGQWGEAWRYNPAGLVFFGVVAFQIPYRIFQIIRIRRGLGEHRFVSVDKWILLALVALLILQWMIGIAWQWVS